VIFVESAAAVKADLPPGHKAKLFTFYSSLRLSILVANPSCGSGLETILSIPTSIYGKYRINFVNPIIFFSLPN
jgi:hypothetical protein